MLLFISCASTAPLPPEIVIYTPTQKDSSDLKQFVGIWGGMLNAGLDIILVVYDINSVTAQTIFSLGDAQNHFWTPQNYYQYLSFDVVDNTTIELAFPPRYKYIFKIEKDVNKMIGYFIDIDDDNKQIAYLKRLKEEDIPNVNVIYYERPIYTHQTKDMQAFELEKSFCERKANNRSIFESADKKESSILREIDRCLKEDYDWKASK